MVKAHLKLPLGEPGAERLLGKGHLAAKLVGESSIITAQVPFVSPERAGGYCQTDSAGRNARVPNDEDSLRRQ